MPAGSEKPAELNSKWILGVLRDRGMPSAALPQIERGVAALNGDARESMRAAVSRLHQGVDSAQDMQQVADWVASLESTAVDVPAQLPAANDPRTSEGNVPSWERGHHVYGAKAALAVEQTVIEAKSERDRSFSTLMVEGALARGDGQTYDWSRKISFRLTRRELPLFTAIAFGWCPRIEFQGHGTANNKRLVIEDQGTNLFVKLSEGKRTIAVQIGADEITPVASLALGAMHRNEPEFDTQSHLQLAKRAGAMLSLGARKE